MVQSASGNLTSTNVGDITSGTGMFVGMQGFVRASSETDLRSGLISNETDIDYSVGK